MDTFRDLIRAYGLAEFAEDVGVHQNTAKQMRRRDSVASEYWAAWVAGAERRGVRDITLDRLARIAAARRCEPERATL